MKFLHKTQLFFIHFRNGKIVQLSISSDPPFLKSCVTLLHSNVFAGQSPTLSTIKPIKIIPSEYCIRIMRESYACGLKTSISRIKDNFQRLTHKSGQLEIDLNT